MEIFSYDKSVGAVSGHGRALNAKDNLLTKIQDSWYETQYSVEKAFESAYGSVTCVSGPLAAFRREAIYNYIPAWENDTFLGKEFKFATDRQLTGYVLGSLYIGKNLKKKYADSPFVKNVNYSEREWKVLYCKSARVWTVVPDTMKKLVRQHVRWKKSFIRHLFYLPFQGDALSGVYYLSGIIFVGSLYGIAFKLENPKSSVWVYRPLMSLISTLVLSWLIFYSLLTIKKGVWHRG